MQMKGYPRIFSIALLLGTILAYLPMPAWSAGDPTLRPGHPDVYVVQKGDTLWGIAARFLQDPWRWYEMWEANPGIKDPSLIYPGDRVILTIDGDGHPHLQVERPQTTVPAASPDNDKDLPVVKLHPQVRVEPLAPEPIPVVNMLSVRSFVKQVRVLTRDELKSSAYVQGAAQKHLLGASSGELIYVRQLAVSTNLKYGIYQQGNAYRNHKGKVIGYEMVRVATAKVQRFGDPAVLRLEETHREVREGDIVLPDIGDEQVYFMPHAAPAGIKGHIIGVVDGVANIGQYQVVTLDLGRKQGLEPGHVLIASRQAESSRDPRTDKPVQGHELRAGILLVYQVYDNFSFALVMEAERPLHTQDTVQSPQP